MSVIVANKRIVAFNYTRENSAYIAHKICTDSTNKVNFLTSIVVRHFLHITAHLLFRYICSAWMEQATTCPGRHRTSA